MPRRRRKPCSKQSIWKFENIRLLRRNLLKVGNLGGNKVSIMYKYRVGKRISVDRLWKYGNIYNSWPSRNIKTIFPVPIVLVSGCKSVSFFAIYGTFFPQIEKEYFCSCDLHADGSLCLGNDQPTCIVSTSLLSYLLYLYRCTWSVGIWIISSLQCFQLQRCKQELSVLCSEIWNSRSWHTK